MPWWWRRWRWAREHHCFPHWLRQCVSSSLAPERFQGGAVRRSIGQLDELALGQPSHQCQSTMAPRLGGCLLTPCLDELHNDTGKAGIGRDRLGEVGQPDAAAHGEAKKRNQ